MEVLEWEQLKEVNSNLRNKNKMTEKNYNPEQKSMKSIKKQKKASESLVDTKKFQKTDDKFLEKKIEETKKEDEKLKSISKNEIEKLGGEKKENVKDEEDKKEKSSKEKEEKSVKKEESSKKPDKKITQKKSNKKEAVVNVKNLPISAKKSAAICSFILGKEIEKAIEELEEVLFKRKVIPMKGEIPHQRGKGIMSGRYPVKTADYFVKLLKSLNSNAISNGLDSPLIITKAVSNIGSRPRGRFGAHRKKRTHVYLEVKNKELAKAQNKIKKPVQNKIKKKK